MITNNNDRHSLNDILVHHNRFFADSSQIMAIWRKNNRDSEDKVLLLTHNRLNFNSKECSILTITDLTKQRKAEML